MVILEDILGFSSESPQPHTKALAPSSTKPLSLLHCHAVAQETTTNCIAVFSADPNAGSCAPSASSASMEVEVSKEPSEIEKAQIMADDEDVEDEE